MRIVHVTHRAWPVIGGSERYVQEIARRQVLEGHQVTILATNADSLDALWDRHGGRLDANTATEYQGVQIRRLAVRHLPIGALAFPALRRLTWLVSHGSVPLALSLAHFSPWVPELSGALAETSADMLFAWNITLEGLTASVVREARQRRVPWIGVPLLHLGQRRFYTMRHQLDLLREASAVLAQTEFERAFLLQRGFEPDQIHVAGPGVDLAEGDRADGQRFRQKFGIQGPLVVTLGTLGYDKGTLHLLSAAQQLWTRGRHLNLALIGLPQPSTRHALARLPTTQRACCYSLGRVSEPDKWDALEAADVVALPSRTESFGIVFLEAWTRGKPVIGARSGGVADIIRDGINGRLIEFGHVSALADAITDLLDHPDLAHALGQRGQDQVQRDYTWDRQYHRVRAVMDRVRTEWKP